MDWRAVSRSRSRISMDWRPQSRSRSRPPQSLTGFDHHGVMSTHTDSRYQLPTIGSTGSLDRRNSYSTRDSHHDGLPISPSIPIPGTSAHTDSRSYLGSSSAPRTGLSGTLPALYEDHDSLAFTHGLHHDAQLDQLNHSSSALNTPAFHPSSLPSFGFHGGSKPSADQSPNARAFPRHVRKTSFDHTVKRENIFTGVSGRHQVNGKPLSPDSLIGQKRRADAPHAESMLRADPSNVDGNLRTTQTHEPDQYVSGSPFPSAPFNFCFPRDYMHGGSYNEFSHMLHGTDDSHSSFHDSVPHPINGSAFGPSVGTTTGENEGLSAAAAAASAAMADSYRISSAAANFPSDDALDYNHLLGLQLQYGNLDAGVAQGPYTVDPTQIQHGDGILQSYHTSPSSDGWGNGVTSSSTASPEPYLTSSASTPPSADGAMNGSNSRNQVRKFASTKRVAQEIRRKKSTLSPTIGTISRSATSTPDLSTREGTTKGSSDDGDQPPTSCTNCETLTTPLWRRDPEGQPLCEFIPPTVIWI